MKKITLLLSLLCVALTQAQTPTTAAPTPPARNAEDVISIYGSAYTNINGDITYPKWAEAQQTVVTSEQIAGNETLKFANFDFQGIDWAGTPQNISAMEYLHVDIWTNNEAPRVFAISTGPEVPHPLVSKPGEWQSIDIPVVGLTGDLSKVIQFKFDGGALGTIYLDNLYFWKNHVAAGTDATLSDLKVDGVTVPGFGPNSMTYAVGVPFGSTSTPQITDAITTDPGAHTEITQASGVPGTATVVVTATNGLITKTYTVNYAYVGPTSAAPTPPNRNASDVISIFSNAYTNIPVDSWSAVWDDSDYEDVQIEGNDTKKIIFNNFIGVDFSTAGHIDISTMERFHMDFWTDNANLDGKVLNPKISDWGGTAAEKTYGILSVNTGSTNPIETGKWVTVDVPMSDWEYPAGAAGSDIAQFLINSNLGVVYVDNIYFYKGTMANSAFAKSSFRMYPTPAKDVLNLSSDSSIENITIYNTLGQIVSKADSSSNEASINVSHLSKGVYILSAEVGDEIVRKQFIKE